jgi:hypothetical protein
LLFCPGQCLRLWLFSLLFFLFFCNFWMCTSLDVEAGFDIHYLKKDYLTKPTLFRLLKIITFSPLSPSHHIKYAKRYKFGVLNIVKKSN